MKQDLLVALFALAFVAGVVECDSNRLSRVKRQFQIGFGIPQGGRDTIHGVVNGFLGGLFRPQHNQPNQQNPNFQNPNFQNPNFQNPNFQNPNFQNPNVQNPNQQGQPQVINPFQLINQFAGAFNPNRADCSNNNGGCEHNCRMRNRGARCSCKQGYVLNDDKKTCRDIDECNSGIENPCQETCTNSVGSFTCSCSNGQVLLPDKKSCGPPAASCSAQNGGCEQICRDKPRGGVRCRCRKGYDLGVDERSCVDIDECASGTDNCPAGQTCSNTEGSFRCGSGNQPTSCQIDNGGCQQRCRENRRGVKCVCRRGFTLQNDGRSCQRPQGAALCSVNNGGCEHKCRQNRRGLRCICNRGFELQSDGTSCVDIDECATGAHDCTEICENTEGSFKCLSRQDQAGCAVDNGGCQHRCRDTRKGIKCVCRKGFELQEDGKSCVKPSVTPSDPCENNGGCDHICVNNNGVAVCECNPGFVLEGGSCKRPIQIGFPGPQPTNPPIVTPAPAESCGINTKKSLFRRIVGGRPADPKDWPWMAAILRKRGETQFCGGTLITSEHIISAAHCFTLVSENDIIVRLGEYDFSTPDENNPTDFSVAFIRSHAQYNRETQENDIALLKLTRPTTFSEFIWPVCLPPLNNDFEDQLGYVTGWGTIHFGGPVSQVLQEIVIPVWNQSECVAAYPENTVSDSMMCAGLKTGGKDSCQGDSGGPFLAQIFPQTRWYIAGIVSWGIECASPNRPGVYTRVNKYLDWIEANKA